jgi:D-amino-acid dehydrogenase
MSRLGDNLRVAGTIELGGFDLALNTPLAKKRCAMLVKRIEEVFPGVADTRTPEEGGNPQFWTGLRPATPTNIPLIGRTKIDKLWINAGHGTLGWTHGAGSGKALAELISGEVSAMDFGFAGMTATPHHEPSANRLGQRCEQHQVISNLCSQQRFVDPARSCNHAQHAVALGGPAA